MFRKQTKNIKKTNNKNQHTVFVDITCDSQHALKLLALRVPERGRADAMADQRGKRLFHLRRCVCECVCV